MNAPLPVEVKQATALAAMTEQELCTVLQSSLYPGAKLESIKLVIGYCRASGLDPMQKPVHIVPMDVKTDKKKPDGKFIYEKHDVIMPGVGLYRTQAARTEALAGISEPEFGPTKTLTWSAGEHGEEKAEFEYPEWCKVTVRRIVQGRIVDFTAVEYWLENYATKERGSKIPNAMWQKRPRGQLAKCAQAQALRMGFPETTGSAPTADEMEGKPLEEGSVIDGATGEVTKIGEPQRKSAPKNVVDAEVVDRETGEVKPADAKKAADAIEKVLDADLAGAAETVPMKPSQVTILTKKLAHAGLTDVDLKAKFGKALLDGEFPNYAFGEFNAIAAWIDERARG
jgi:phage recombination protein Bet